MIVPRMVARDRRDDQAELAHAVMVLPTLRQNSTSRKSSKSRARVCSVAVGKNRDMQDPECRDQLPGDEEAEDSSDAEQAPSQRAPCARPAESSADRVAGRRAGRTLVARVRPGRQDRPR